MCMSVIPFKLCTPFSSINICNINLIQLTKLREIAKKLVFGYLDHPKRHFLIIE